MAIHSVLLRVTNAGAWAARCESLAARRRLLFNDKLIRSREESECIIRAKKQVAAMVVNNLTKVLRNDMHRKLEEHTVRIKQEDAASPSQTVSIFDD